MGIFGTSKLKLFAGEDKVKKAYLGDTKIYSAGNIVTYRVDSGVTYQEEVDSDASCLNPTTFTPTKNGWTFVGWKTHDAASADVLTSKIMGDEPVTLYAVFKQAVTLYYYNGSTTKQNKSDYRYYNNGNTANPSFVMSQTTASGWTARGWATGTAGNASVAYSNGANITISADTTIYGLYQQTITLSYYNNSTTKQTTTGTRYWNSGSNAYVNPTFTLSQASKSGWTARGWATGTAGNASVAYSSISGTAFSENTTVYGLYYKTIIQRFIHANRTTANSEEVYFNSYGNTTYPYITMHTIEAKDGWTAIGWTDNNPAANASVDFSSGQTNVRVTIDENYFYALYEQKVTNTFISYNSTQYASGYRYYNASGSQVDATVTAPSGATYSGWAWRGWSAANTTTANASPYFSNGATMDGCTASATYYGLYYKTVYLYYNGNGSTGGSVSTQEGTAYYNAYGNTLGHLFTLASNGYSRTNYTFTGWDLGAVGATVRLSSNATAYAQWTATKVNHNFTHSVSHYCQTSFGGYSGWYDVPVTNATVSYTFKIGSHQVAPGCGLTLGNSSGTVATLVNVDGYYRDETYTGTYKITTAGTYRFYIGGWDNDVNREEAATTSATISITN